MHLYRRKNGFYYIHFKENGKWKLLSSKTKKSSEIKNYFTDFIKKYSTEGTIG
jgi:hypothetical protein